MTITVFEQDLLPVHPKRAGDGHVIDQVIAEKLIDLGGRMGARIASWHSPSRVRVHQYVGMVRIGDFHLEILPKLEGLPEPAQIRTNLVSMLAKTQGLELKASEAVRVVGSPDPFIKDLASLYVRRLLEAVRKGLRQDYVVHQEPLQRLRGKVDWARQIKLQANRRIEFNCTFDDRSDDTPLNRALKAALVVAGPLLEGGSLSSTVTELRHFLEGVSDACPSPVELSRLRTDRMNRSLAPLLTLAKLILGHQNPDQGRSNKGSDSTYALIWDMNVLFEEYVGRVAQELIEGNGVRVKLQESSLHLAKRTDTGTNSFLLRPDILVHQGQKPLLVADTKWKRLDPGETNLGLTESDLYQLLAYAHRYQVERAVLLYPHHPAMGPPGFKREFAIQGSASWKVHVRVVTLDLARLEHIPEQLLGGMGQIRFEVGQPPLT